MFRIFRVHELWGRKISLNITTLDCRTSASAEAAAEAATSRCCPAIQSFSPGGPAVAVRNFSPH